MKNNFITKIIGATLAFAMMIGGAVGINAVKEAKEVNADNIACAMTGNVDVTVKEASDSTGDAAQEGKKMNKGASGTITIPAAAGSTTLYYHAVAWNGEAQTISLSCTNATLSASSQDITAHSDVSGNKTTYVIGSFTNYAYSVDLTQTTAADMVLTLTAASGKRFVIFYAYYSTSGGDVPVRTSTTTEITAPNNKNTLDLALTPTDTVQLSAEVTYETGTVNNPEITWTSTNANIATVDSSGLVTPVARGSTTITAAYTGDETYAPSSAQKVINVTNSNQVYFDFPALAAENSWVNETHYNPSLDGVTITTNNESNGKYYTSSGGSWRMYNGGSLTITPPSGKSISAVSSTPSYTFTVANGGVSATASFTAKVEFKNITVTLAPEKVLDTISASITNTSRVWRTNDVVAASDLTVIPHYTDGTDGTPITDGAGVTVTNGTLQNVGDNTVNVSFGGKSTTVTVNALSSEIVEWTITGEIGETVKSTAYDLSGLTLHGWYDNGKTDEASASVINLYEMVANPAIADSTPNPSNTINVEVYLKTDTGRQDCKKTFTNVAAPIANSPKGSQDNPYTVSEARDAIDSLNTINNAYVSGKISQIGQYNETYHSITYWISDDGTSTNQLQVYSGKGLNGADFASENDIKLLASVVVTGTLKMHGSTYEFDYDNQLVEYSVASEEDVVNFYKRNASSVTSISGTEHFADSNSDSDTITFSEKGLTNGEQYLNPFNFGECSVVFAGGGNDGKYYTTGSGIRTYAGGSFTVSSQYSIVKIELTWDGDNKPSTSEVVNVGTLNNTASEWTGNAKSVTFTRPSGSGHWRLQSITATYEIATFESVDSIALRFGASISVTDWDAINADERMEITDYGVMLYKTKAQYAESAPTVQDRYAANHSYVAIFNKGSGVAPTAEDGKYTFTARIDYTDETEYSKYIIAQAFIVVNGTDYYFLGEEMRESVRTLAGKANVETNLSSDALTYLTTAGN